MRKLLFISLSLFLAVPLFAREKEEKYAITDEVAWFEITYRKPAEAPESKDLPLISVKENRFVDPEGNPVLFRGANIADPDQLEFDGHWNRELFAFIKDMGADLVRIPVHPAAWRRRGADDYLHLLDQAAAWATGLEMYLIIDWHSIGNLKTGLFQHPMYDTSIPETSRFWHTIARHFQGHNTVAFYEIYNEPAMYRGQLGKFTWSEWKEINEEMITIIRYFDKEVIPLVAGLDWAYDLSFLRYDPLDVAGIGYVTHPYPNKRPEPWETRWEENFAFAAMKWPVIATEIGFWSPEGEDEVIDDDHYGNRITRFLEERGISWVAWVLDPLWHPNMLEDWDFNLSPQGEFFKEAMQRDPAPPIPWKQ